MRPNIGMVEYGDHSQVYNSRKLKKRNSYNNIVVMETTY